MGRVITIVGTLGGVAALVAAIGIFGLVAFTVSQRTREIGVRMALGAPGRHILRTVLGQYAIPVVAGAVAGIGIARALSQVLHNQVPGLRPHDAAGYIAGVALFTAVALAAGLLPARRALRINPSDALRSE